MYSLLLLGILISGVSAGYYFVTVPNMIRYDHEETVVVSVFGLNKATVKIWLQNGKTKFSEKDVLVEDEEHPQRETIRVAEKDLFPTVVEEKPRKMQVCSEYGGNSQCRDVILSYQTGYLIVQTDKPIYTPHQTVQVRTLALDESLKAVDDWQVGMDIVSPSNMTVARRTSKKSDSGFYKNSFTLPPFPETGLWTARSFYSGQFETASRAVFEVQEYVLPTFGVTIDVDVPYIIEDTTDIHVTVRSKYVYGKGVDGNARLTLNLKDESGVSEYILDVSRGWLEGGFGNEGSVKEFLISVEDIVFSPLLRDRDFPDGCRLEIVATVFESATGKEEATSHDGTIFALHPYIFKFTRSKLNFRPGWEYFLKVDMQYANGQPVSGEDITVNMYKNDEFHDFQQITTDSKGYGVAIFVTTNEAATLSFTAETLDRRQESDRLYVQAYGGENQIQAERIIKGKDMVLRASTNIQGSGYTGMLFMVVTRGQIVYTKFKETGNQASEILTEDIQNLISPSGRLLVFYVDKGSNVLVADSVKFDVDQKCRDKGLSLKTNNIQVVPGSTDQLNITGDPLMWVGLNVMDKALLLLNNKNVLRKNKMFEALESHDLGCGEGSGRNSADVFKKTGLTVLTNAVISDNDLQREAGDCENKRRKRRQYGECFYGAEIKCCDLGLAYAEELFYEFEADHGDNFGLLDPYTKCYAGARKLTIGFKAPLKCIMAYLTECTKELELIISDTTNIVSKSLDDESDYASDLARIMDEGVKPKTRSDFRESWFFDVVQLDNEGKTRKVLNYPDSITTWMVQAIGITANKGMCIADPVEVTAFRNFFIQLDLPYKATRLEHFDVKATIFSYGMPDDDPKTAKIYLEGVKHLCYNTESGEPSPAVIIELPPNSAETVRFPMIPLKGGKKFSVKITAIVSGSGIPELDAVEKKLYVVNEGIEEKVSIQVCLDPGLQMNDCKNDPRVIREVAEHGEEAGRIYTVDLTLPRTSIAGTGAATGYIQSNIMDNAVKAIIEGVDSLFQKPAGCGEQTIIRLAPTVYAMMYLKQTKQVTKDIEDKGNLYIRDGVDREVIHFRHADGSYSSWRGRPPSTWLSAFVAKVFCQAKKVVDDAVDKKKDIEITIDWLKTQVTDDGHFIDGMPVMDRRMIGQLKEGDPSLTAFVLVTLTECNIDRQGVNDTIKKSTEYIENLNRAMLRNNPYILALSTYALAKAKSPKRWEFKNLLQDISNNDGGDIYWGNPGGNPANAHSVETTAYALLAMMEFNDWSTSAHIVRWLTSQRDAQGSFRTTQDTVVGLQALSTYSIKTYLQDVNLKISLYANGWQPQNLFATNQNAVVQQIAHNLPVEHNDNLLNIKVTGTGAARMLIDLRYNRPAKKEEVCPFEISDVEVEELDDIPIDVNLARELKCDVCGRCENEVQPADFNYDDFEPPEVEPKIGSHFGRRKRQANRRPRASSTKICIDFSVSARSGKKHGMSIVNFGLETGVEVVKDDLDELLKNTQNIARYEMPTSGKGFIVFYLDEITKEETRFIFRLKDGFIGNIKTRQPSSIVVYDYYNPDQSCTQFYGTGPTREEGVSFECDKRQKECKCLQSMCAQPVEDEIRAFAQEGKRPASKLYKYSCDPEKSNYAVIVEIEDIGYDLDTEQKTARGRVIKSVHTGIEPLEKDDEMSFFWNLNCDKPELKEGETYLIIGKDGNKFATEHGDQYKYPLMGTTLIIKKPVRRQQLMFRVFTTYQQIMNRSGCRN